MKKKIFRKIIFDINNFFLIVLLSVTSIVWVIQAVNFLDFVSEDGHGFYVYFYYTILNFPKIKFRGVKEINCVKIDNSAIIIICK